MKMLPSNMWGILHTELYNKAKYPKKPNMSERDNRGTPKEPVPKFK
jgi:hypothetical protein